MENLQLKLAKLEEAERARMENVQLEGQEEVTARFKHQIEELEEAARATAADQQNKDDVTARTMQNLQSDRDERVAQVELLKSELDKKVIELGELKERIKCNLQNPDLVEHLQQQLQQQTLRTDTQTSQCEDLLCKEAGRY